MDNYRENNNMFGLSDYGAGYISGIISVIIVEFLAFLYIF